MKIQNLINSIFAVVFICTGTVAVAQPSWTVNPNLYDYSMTVTGKIVIDGAVSVDQNDLVAAFIGGECRGVVNVKYQSALNDYLVFLMIYSNTPTGSISFKVFDASANKELDVSSAISFSINGIVGSVSSPHEFSVVTKTYEAKILSFSIPEQEGTTGIWNNTVTLSQKVSGDLGYIAPSFSLSDGAMAYIDNVLQVSGSTINDYRSPVQYKIVPLVGDPVYYWVSISKAADTSTKIILSNLTVEENRDSVLVSELTAESDYLGSSYVFSLENATGTDNQYFYISGNRLFVKNALDYEIKPQYRVNIQVANNSGISKQMVFTIAVTDRNDPPKGISVSSGTIKESAGENELVARLIVNDDDKNDTHIFSFAGGIDSGYDNSYFLIKGDSLILKNKISRLGKENLKIRVKVTDKSGATVEKELILKVVDLNNPPQITSKPPSFAVQNQVYAYQIQATDMEGDPLEVSFEGLPEWLKFNKTTGLLSGVPYNEFVGDCQFNIIVSDGVKETVQQVTFSVLNVNDPPEIQFYPATQYFYTGRENTVSLAGSITDPDADDKLTFLLSTENNSAIPDWMIFDPLTLTISGNPPGDKRGIYSLKLRATDGGNLKEYLIFSIEVSFPTSIENLDNDIRFRVFPNPVENILYIHVPFGKEADISISNLAGQMLKTIQLLPGMSRQIPINELDAGIYILRFRQGEIQHTEKIVKQ